MQLSCRCSASAAPIAGTKRFCKSFRTHKAENNSTQRRFYGIPPNPELEKLRAEKEKNEKEIEQINHKITQLENRQKYFEDGERKRRTHRLCTIAGTLESIAPEIKELDITEVMELLEHVFHKEEIQKLVHRMKINHDSRLRRAKEG